MYNKNRKAYMDEEEANFIAKFYGKFKKHGIFISGRLGRVNPIHKCLFLNS